MTNETEKALKTASNGLVSLYEKDLTKVKNDLNYLTLKQNNLLNEVTREKNNFSDENVNCCLEMMNHIKVYKEKLIQIKQQMSFIHKKTRNLKKRTADIQEYKEKELTAKIQKRQNEEALIAKSISTTAATLPSSSTNSN